MFNMIHMLQYTHVFFTTALYICINGAGFWLPYGYRAWLPWLPSGYLGNHPVAVVCSFIEFRFTARHQHTTVTLCYLMIINSR